MNVYFTLAAEFFKIGLFSVGGGLATLPFLYKLADSHDWFTRHMLVDMIAISESTPGPIGANMATYAGYSAAGISGGIIATLSLVTPSVIIALFITKAVDAFKENKYVKSAFYGIRPAVTALIAFAAFGIIKITLVNAQSFAEKGFTLEIFNFRRIALFTVMLYLIKKYNRHPVFYIAGAAAVGVVLGL